MLSVYVNQLIYLGMCFIRACACNFCSHLLKLHNQVNTGGCKKKIKRHLTSIYANFLIYLLNGCKFIV